MDYYDAKFHTTLEAPAVALDWIEKKLRGPFNEDDDDWEPPPCEFERCDMNKIELWANQEDFDIDRLAEAVCEMQTMFDLKDPWSTTWANYICELNQSHSAEER